ncbi:hypothetical protein LPJ78_002951 [Coemansia sp. RSA 989]|nr:hypothetical protein LPJ78_002951 [Coemansia sp. RSA 989]
MGSPQKYCHKLSLQKSTDAGSFFAMGIVDFVELYRDRSLKWTRMIREQLISEELDIVIDISSETDVTGSNQLGQIAQAPSKNAFSGWISDTCMIFASSLDPLTWKNASICEEGSKTILVLTIDWKDLLLYKLGSSGWYEGPVYTRYLDALLQHNVKAAVLKTGHRFYLVEVWDRRYCDGVFCKPETAVPVCGYMAQFLRLCPPVSGASLFSGFGRVMRLDAYGISKDMFEDNGEAELPIVERVELFIQWVKALPAAIRDHNLPFAIAPAGASAVLIFAVPASPLAQPRNVIVGHVISALIGTFMNALFRHAAESFRWMPAALAVGISIFLMGLTNCYHPPAGATAFLGGFFASDFEAVRWWFPLYPVLPVALIMVAIGLIVNNICRVYPIYWFTPVHVPKAHSSPQPLPGEYADQANADNLDKELPAAAERGQISPSSVSMQPSPNDSSSSSVINPEGEVNDEAGNEMETQVAWLRARVHELEMELAHARHARQIYTFKTAHPDLA